MHFLFDRLAFLVYNIFVGDSSRLPQRLSITFRGQSASVVFDLLHILTNFGLIVLLPEKNLKRTLILITQCFGQ